MEEKATGTLRKLTCHEKLNELLSRFVRKRFSGHQPISILEAGSGNRRLPGPGILRCNLTRLAPFRTDVLFKKNSRQRPRAGEPRCGPFPLLDDRVISRHGRHAFCNEHVLGSLEVYGSIFHINRPGTLQLTKLAFQKALQALSFGQLRTGHKKLAYILGKPERAARQTHQLLRSLARTRVRTTTSPAGATNFGAIA